MADGSPRFDLLLLGMGDDGHTASLFPHSPGLHEHKRWVIANPVEKLGQTRITLTFPAINNAAIIAFLVSGEEKAATLHRVLENPRDVETYPAQGVVPIAGRLLWLADDAALGK
jgi:6-phosphogluconolactonase